MTFEPESVPLGQASPRITGWLDRFQERARTQLDDSADRFYRRPYQKITGLGSTSTLQLPDRGGIYDIDGPDILGVNVEMPANPQPGDTVTILCSAFLIYIQPFTLEGLTTARTSIGVRQHVTFWWDQDWQSWRRLGAPKDLLSLHPGDSGPIPPGGSAWLPAAGIRIGGKALFFPKLEAVLAGNNSLWIRRNAADPDLEDSFALSCAGMVEDLTSATVKTFQIEYYVGIDIAMVTSFPWANTRMIWRGQTSGVLGVAGQTSFCDYQAPRESDIMINFYQGILVTSDAGNVGDLEVKNVSHTVEYIYRD